MIRETKSFARISGLALLLVFAGLPGSALAQEAFRLWVDPVDFWVLEMEQDTKSSQFQEYRDLSSGLWAGLNLYGESGDGGDRNFAIRLKGIGRDDARYKLDYRVEGEYSFSLDYNQIPHRFGNDAGLAWDRPAPNRLEFPDPVQGLSTDEIAAFVASADRVDLGLRRDRTEARFERGKLSRMAWSFDFFNENRNGDRPLGVAFGFGNVEEIPEPIDYTTTGARITGEFSGEKGGVRFGYQYSSFENNFGIVVWDNPFNAVEAAGDPSRGRYDLAADNEANQLFLDGRARAGAWWFNGNVFYNTMQQNDQLLPYTINTAIQGFLPGGGTFPAASTAGLPALRADNDAEIFGLSANAGTDFGEDWSLTFRYRTYDYDNTSPRLVFPGYVRLDERWEEDGLITVPYSYSRDNFAVEVGWEASTRTHLALSWEVESWDRDFREIRDSDEDVIKLSLDSRPSDKVNLRASWATGDRSIGEYRTEAQLVFFVDPHDIDNLPGLRKYDQAARDVDDYDLALQFFPDDEWNFSIGFSGWEEDYGESEFGLVSDDLANVNVEFGYAPGEDFNFFLFAHNEDRDVFQRNRQSGRTLSTNPDDNWTAAFVEDTLTWGLGVSSTFDSGWSLDLSLYVSDSDGEIDFETPPGGSPSEAVDIGNYEDIELFSTRLKASYELNERVSCGVFVLYETYEIDSFIRQGLQPFIASTLLLVANDGDYRGTLFGANVRVKF